MSLSSMAFYLCIKGKPTPHYFDYINTCDRPRLEDTLITGQSRPPKKITHGKRFYAIEIMTKKLITIAPQRTIQDAMALYRRNRIHHIPVLTDNILTGMLSDRDLHKVNFQDYPKVRVSRIMESTILCAHEDTELQDIAEVMIREYISALPIIDSNFKVTGMVTTRDLLQWVVDEKWY